MSFSIIYNWHREKDDHSDNKLFVTDQLGNAASVLDVLIKTLPLYLHNWSEFSEFHNVTIYCRTTIKCSLLTPSPSPGKGKRRKRKRDLEAGKF